MGVPGERVQHEHGIVTGAVERAVRLVGDGDLRQVTAEFEIHRAEMGVAASDATLPPRHLGG